LLDIFFDQWPLIKWENAAMERPYLWWKAGLLPVMLSLWLLGTISGLAQDMAGGGGSGKVSINKVDIIKLKTPAYSGAYSDPRARSTEDWLQFMLEYRTANGQGRGSDGKLGWQDEVTIEWNILIKRRDLKDLLLRRSVTYIDVEDKRTTHYADLYLRPGFIKRYCKGLNKSEVSVFVQIKVNGQTEARYRSDRETGRWWTLEPPKIAVFDREALSRAETPFAPLDYDQYEQEKPQLAR